MTHHSEFVEMAEMIDDPYWRDKLILAAENKFPRKVSYKDGEIRFRKGSNFITEMLNGSPEEAAFKFIHFVQKHTGLSSETDKIENSKTLARVSGRYKPLTECSWKDITGRQTKSEILFRYANKMTEIMHLTPIQRNQLLKTIQCALLCGQIGDSHIKMHEGQIYQIDGLYFDGQFKFDPNFASYRSQSKPKKDIPINIDNPLHIRFRPIPTIGPIINGIIKHFMNLADAPMQYVIPEITFIIVDSNDSNESFSSSKDLYEESAEDSYYDGSAPLFAIECQQ